MRTIPRLLHRSHVPNNLIDPSIRERAQTKKGNSREQQPPATQNMWHGLTIGLTVVICLAFSGSPTIVLLRHARIANIARVFDERTSVPAGRSLSRCRISSRSINIFAPSQGHASDETKDTRRTLGIKLGVLAHGLRHKPQSSPRRLVLLDRDLEPVLLQHAHVLERDELVRSRQLQYARAVPSR